MTGYTDRTLEERDRRFRELHARGYTWQQIQQEMGYKNLHSVHRIARGLGLMGPSQRVSKAELAARWVKIAELAEQGHSSKQIADGLGINLEWLRESARRRGLTFPSDELLTKRPPLDPNRVADQTVVALMGAATGLELIDYERLDPVKLEHWLLALGPAMSALNNFHRKIKEAAK